MSSYEYERWDDRSRALYRRWVIVCSVVSLGSLLLGYALRLALGKPLLIYDGLTADTLVLLAYYIPILGQLVAVPTAEWIVVRRYIRRRNWWIPVSLIGWLVGGLLSSALQAGVLVLWPDGVLPSLPEPVHSILGEAMIMAVLYAGLGISQGWFFGGLRRAAWWVLDNGIGGAIGGAITAIGWLLLYRPDADLLTQAGLAVTGYAALLGFTLYLGYTLVSLLQEMRPVEGLVAEQPAGVVGGQLDPGVGLAAPGESPELASGVVTVSAPRAGSATDAAAR